MTTHQPPGDAPRLVEAVTALLDAIITRWPHQEDDPFYELGGAVRAALAAAPLPPSAPPKPAPATPTDDDREWALSTAKSLFGEDGKADPNDMAAVAHRAVERAAAAEIALAKAKPAPAEVVEALRHLAMSDSTSDAPSNDKPGPFTKLVDREWQTLLEKDDRTSPAEYPEMCLITRTELAWAMTEASVFSKDDSRAALAAASEAAPVTLPAGEE